VSRARQLLRTVDDGELGQAMAEVAPGELGQAMAEYAIVVAVLTLVVFGVGFNFLPDFMNALQRYYDNFYTMLNLPIP